MVVFIYLLFFALLYKELLELIFLVLHKLCKVFGCSVVTDFISTMFGFLKDFG